jgi:DNA repair protein RecN (Recombination protein N)
MLIGLAIRDVVLIEALDLAVGPGLTVLTGETGAGKSIILDSLGLATGARADAGLVRHGSAQASVTAIFALAADHGVFAALDDKGLSYDRDEDLVLRRQLSADGRSRAFVNDQATSVAVLKELGALLMEVHGQHDTVGLLEQKTHRPLLDAYGCLSMVAVSQAWSRWRAARVKLEDITRATERSGEESRDLSERLAELDRLAAREGEEEALAAERGLLGSAEKTLSDISSAASLVGGQSFASKLGQALRAVERARERALNAGADPQSTAIRRLTEAAEAIDRAAIEAHEASAAIDSAISAFEFRPDRLEKTEERLFALRAMARKQGVTVEQLPALRIDLAKRLQGLESLDDQLKACQMAETQARLDYDAVAASLSVERRAAADQLTKSVQSELAPLKLDKARFQVRIEDLGQERAGPTGRDRVAFEISTNPGTPFGPLESVASGGELARFALALKAALAGRGTGPQPLMIFDEVDQGVGGAVADAVGSRLKRLAEDAQVLVVTHSAQVAARAMAHWRIAKTSRSDEVRTRVDVLSDAERTEEIARMLSGAEVNEAARAAARVLLEG